MRYNSVIFNLAVALIAVIFVFVIFGTATVFNSWQNAKSLDNKDGQKDYFEQYLEPAANKQLTDTLAPLRDTAELQRWSLIFAARKAQGQFFADSISGRVVANQRIRYVGLTNADIGGPINGKLWQAAFDKVKSEALRHPNKTFRLSYFDDTDKESIRIGTAYYDAENGLILGRVYTEVDFLQLRARHMERIYPLALLSFVAIMLGLLAFVYVFRKYSQRDRSFHEYELALNTSDTAVALLDEESRITFANKVFRDQYQGHYRDKKLTEVSTYPKIKEKFEECLKTGSATYRNRGRASGQVVTSSVILTRYKGRNGWKVMMVITDITEIVEAYRAVAHDMKNPLYAPQIEIDTALLELEHGNLPNERIKAILHAIHDRVVACESYALYLEAWGRNEVEANDETPKPINISQTIQTLANLFESSFKTHRIDARFDLQPNLLLSTKRRSFEAVIRNLLTNAIAAFKQKDTRQITVAAYTSGDNLVIDVIDNAEGMTQKRRESLFSEDIDKIAGGARIVVYYAKRMGGEVFVKKSILGQGTTVTLQIPLR